jgi:hypothetical protein
MNVNSHSAPKHSLSGLLISVPKDGGPTITQETVTCKHCSYTWVFKPGSGRRRGFCMRCNGITCGRPECNAHGCVPFEQQLENIEAGRPIGYRPITVRMEGAYLLKKKAS